MREDKGLLAFDATGVFGRAIKTIAALLAAALALPTLADTTMLDPGDGRLYLAQWCGGQDIQNVATGFMDHQATTLLQVSARCSTGGRGGAQKTYRACWLVNYALDGTIAYREKLSDAECVFPDTSSEPYELEGYLLFTASIWYVSGSRRSGPRAFLTTP
jgi:hypothetical protein